MAAEKDPKTKTVRFPVAEANMLQTIASLKEEMGEKFKTVDFLVGLTSKPIRKLHAETLEQYTRWKTKERKTE
jgi:hypothetical protein